MTGQHSQVDLRQLRYFVAIVEAKSFSRAAQRLRVAQPALSLHVRNMEADLGAELLTRTPQGVAPTEAGLLLLQRARKILADFEGAKLAVQELNSCPAGEVHLGLPATIAEFLAVPLILKTRERYPKIRLKIAEAMSGFVLQWLHEGQIDLGILYLPMEQRGLRSTAIAVEQLHLFVSPEIEFPDRLADNEAVDFATVAKLPLILPGPGHGLRALVDAELELLQLELSTVIDVNSYRVIKALVQYGQGFSILPVNAIAEELASGAFRSWPINDPPFGRTVHLVQQFERPLSSAATAVLQLCKDTLHELIASGRWPTTPAGPV